MSFGRSFRMSFVVNIFLNSGGKKKVCQSLFFIYFFFFRNISTVFFVNNLDIRLTLYNCRDEEGL